jgi:hypothetical protein
MGFQCTYKGRWVQIRVPVARCTVVMPEDLSAAIVPVSYRYAYQVLTALYPGSADRSANGICNNTCRDLA